MAKYNYAQLKKMVEEGATLTEMLASMPQFGYLDAISQVITEEGLRDAWDAGRRAKRNRRHEEVWQLIAPYYTEGLTVEAIAERTGLTKGRVRDACKRKRFTEA